MLSLRVSADWCYVACEQNFALYPDFNPKVEKVFMSFLGFDEEGKPLQYRLRVKTKEMVEELDQKMREATKLL